jgi:GNAT superfamily N-acetyltransferase
VTDLRAATAGDLAAIRAIADAEEAPPVAEDGGFPEALDAYYLHLITRGEVVVAEEAGRAVGFGATISSSRGVHLADLFVVRDRQGAGIGRAILDVLYAADPWPRTTFSSDDPRALPLYVRFGMRPLWPNLYLSGDGRRLPEPGGGLVVERVSWEEVAGLERDWWGVDRPLEHRFFASQPASVAMVVRAGDGRPVAAGDARSLLRGGGRWINEFFVAPGTPPHDPTVAALRWSADAEGRIGGCVPGPHPVVSTLVAAGFRVVDRDVYQASDATLIDPERVIVNTGIL